MGIKPALRQERPNKIAQAGPGRPSARRVADAFPKTIPSPGLEPRRLDRRPEEWPGSLTWKPGMEAPSARLGSLAVGPPPELWEPKNNPRAVRRAELEQTLAESRAQACGKQNQNRQIVPSNQGIQ